MTKPPAKSTGRPDLEEQRDAHLKRLDTAATVHGMQTTAFQNQKSASVPKYDGLREYVLSDWYDPAMAELAIGPYSEAGSVKGRIVSINNSEYARLKGAKNIPRNAFLKIIENHVRHRFLEYGEGMVHDKIREVIVDALAARNGSEEPCELDEWLDDLDDELYDDEVLARCRNSDGEVITAKRIGNILRGK